MPSFTVTGPDGRSYTVNAPKGATEKQAIAYVADTYYQKGKSKHGSSPIEDVPLVGGILAPIADIPLSAVEGLAGVSKSFTDLFGADNAASDFADDVRRMAGDLRSAGSREDEAAASKIRAEAEGKGLWEEVKAAARAFTYSPLESTASAAGSAIPFIAAGLAAPATGGSSLVPVATMAGLGAASGVGTIKGAIYDSVYEEFKRAGASDKDAIAAAERAQEYGGKNMDQMALGGALGALASATGFSRQIATTIGKNAAAKAAARVAAREAAGEGVEVGARRGLISGTARGIAEEAIPEAIQGGQEKLAANIAAQREGFDVDTWKGVAGQAVTEGLASILLGGYGGARETRQENRDLLVKELQKEFDALPPTADEKQLGDAVERFTRRGFPPEIAQRVVKRMADEKVAIEERAAAMAKAREEAVAARTAGVSPPADVDISAPPPVDQEEQAAMQQMREAEAMGIEPSTSVPSPVGASVTPPTAREFVKQRDAEMDAAAQRKFTEMNAMLAEQGLPTMEAPPSMRPSAKQPSTVTPMRATTILNDPVQFSDFQATTGMDEQEALSTLTAIADGEGVELKYSRRGRPPSASTLEEAGQDSLFGALPTEQKERLSKREEVAQFQLGQRGKSPEEIEQERQQRADEYTALQERAKERDAQFTSEFVDRIAAAVREAHPANAAYSVEVVPENPKPYRIVGPDNELFVASDNLQDFEEQAMELTPYTPPPLSAQQVEDDTTQPTVATSMVQGLTKEIDATLMRGEIDNNQRAELLAPLYRPAAYDKFNRPMDNIAKAEAEARAAMSKFRNATGAEAKAAEAELVIANEKLAKLVNNRLLNPVRSKLRSMTENRQLEREGATLRKETARVQKRLGEMEGADTAPEQREMREAAIDIEETKPSKYRKPDAKPQTKTNLKEVEQVVEQATRGWKGPADVVVVQSVNDITDPAIRNAIKRDNATDAEGFVTPDGTVYLIADNLESVERARAVLFHEGLGHIGLARLFREELDAALLAMYKGNGTLRAQADEWLRQNPDAYRGDNQTVRAIEEVLAERSEAGYIKPGFFKRLAAIVRNFARRLGMKIALSDADVEAILATAHEQVIKGGNPTGTAGTRYIAKPGGTKFSKPKTTKKTAEALQETEADMSVGLRRMEKTRSTYDAAEGLEQSIKGRKMEPFIDAFKENYSGMKPAALVATLRVMPTSGILNWFSTDIPRLKEVDDLMQRMVAMKANILKAADPIAVALQEFLVRDEDKLLARSMGINRINEMSPDEFKSAADALANHPAMKELKKRILQNSNDKKLAQQTIDDVVKAVMEYKSALPKNGDITKMPQAFQRLIMQLDKTAIDVKATAVQQKQLVELVRRIRDTYAAWDALGELEGGQELYKQVRSFYKDMFEAELALLDARIDKLGDAKEAKRLRDLRADMMREVLNPEEARKAGDIFWNMDADLFSKDYFPFMREGLYWLRVKASKGREREREFYTFQTAKEMQRAQKAVAARLKVDPEDPEVIEVGYDISTLQQALKSEDQIMQKVFDIVAKAKEQFQSSGVLGPKDFSDLTDSIYQTWLMTTPERSVRRRFMHADEVVGQQLDVLQQFSTQATNYANQLSKMAFAGDVRLALSAAEDSVVDRPATEKAKLKAVINEFSERAESEINPDPQSALVNLLNRASYFYYLTSASTALLQMTSIPIRVVPRLWRDYGFAKGTAMWVKYMKLWKSLGRAKTEKISTGIGDQLHAMTPNVMGSKLLNDGSERSKLLKRAMDVGMERNILETVQDTLVQNEREVAKRTKTGAARVASNVAAETGKIMGVMFQGMENITRQSAYFMAFELAYDDIKAKKPKASEDEVFNEAVNRALDTVRDTLGDYSNWERSRLMKKDWTRAVFLFKMHPIVQTKFMVGAFRDIIRGFYPGSTPEMKAARAGAMKELMGVTMMAGMFGGLMAMPLYTPLAWALAEGFDDEDDEDVRKLMGMDPRVAYDSDIMFRAWMMEKFGTPKLGNVPLADLLVHGPLAALTDTELASRVSLDLKSMWFREAVAGDSTADVMVKTALANIAPGQMLIQMLNAKDNFADGDIYGGLRKLAPAFFRSWIAGAQGEIEGIETRKGDMIIPKEDITAFDTARTLLGFRPMTLARWQDYYITRSKNDKKIEGEKSKLLAKLDRKIRDGEITNVQELREFWKDEILPFNRSYPDEALVITPDSIERSLKGREEVRGRTVKGMQLDKKTAVKDYEAAKPFMP